MKIEREDTGFKPVVITLETPLELYWMKRFLGYSCDCEFNDNIGDSLSLEFWNKLQEFQ